MEAKNELEELKDVEEDENFLDDGLEQDKAEPEGQPNS
jgi:hypothetical protein